MTTGSHSTAARMRDERRMSASMDEWEKKPTRSTERVSATSSTSAAVSGVGSLTTTSVTLRASSSKSLV